MLRDYFSCVKTLYTYYDKQRTVFKHINQLNGKKKERKSIIYSKTKRVHWSERIINKQIKITRIFIEYKIIQLD